MEDIYSSENELMGEDAGRPKLVILNTIQGSSLMSLVLEENEDSFLIAFPAKLVQSDAGDVEVDPYIPVPYARFLKTGILFITPIFGTFELKYLNYLLTECIEEYPDAITDDGVKELLERLSVVTASKEAEMAEAISTVENAMYSGELDYVEPEDIEDVKDASTYLTSLNNKYKH